MRWARYRRWVFRSKTWTRDCSTFLATWAMRPSCSAGRMGRTKSPITTAWKRASPGASQSRTPSALPVAGAHTEPLRLGDPFPVAVRGLFATQVTVFGGGVEFALHGIAVDVHQALFPGVLELSVFGMAFGDVLFDFFFAGAGEVVDHERA